MKTNQKISLVVAITVLFSILAFNVSAATITSCTLNKTVYYQTDIGYVPLMVYNNMDDTIRVFEITGTINYYYADGTTYLQTFYTNATLPIEIALAQSHTFYIPFSLPTNVAPGYTEILVRAKTELWNAGSQRWYQSDFPIAEPVLYIESPYKQQFEQQQAINAQLENTINLLQAQLQNIQTSYNNMTLMVYMLVAVTIALGMVIAFIMKLIWRSRITPQPILQ